MAESKPIRVLIVDDHAVVRSGLSAFLFIYPDLELAGEAESGEDAVQFCDQIPPDVVLMDMVMPGMDGAAATRIIREHHPEVQVVALTSFSEDRLIQEALQAGAISYLLKNVSAEQLVDAIRAAYAGKPTLSPEATQALIHATTAPPAVGHDLTPREREVLSLLAKGLNNTEIGEQLYISHSTVQFHVSSILSKLGVSNRVEAATLAVQNNLVT